MAQKRKRRIPVADLECCLQAEQLHRRSVRRQSHWEDAYQTEIGKLKMVMDLSESPRHLWQLFLMMSLLKLNLS